MEDAPRMKPDEQYPLLKVEAGGGDSVIRNQGSHSNVPSVWHVACTPKQSWCSRWPEFVSACWMTIILLSITFLVFYALGMSAYRRQSVVIVRCNDTKPAGDVYYHHVVPKEAYVPFALFSEYVSYMAKQYPLLRFNVYFLIDDSWQGSVRASKHSKLLKKLVPHITGPFNTFFDQNYKREIKNFQKRFQNVNISVMHLSKYMSMTPLRYKWRTIPLNYLSFYARVYSIWQYGGIGLDLATFNNEFNKGQTIDRRVDAILRQHNDGIDTEKYAEALRSFDNEEQNDIFSMFFNFINQIFNETCTFFDTDLTTDIKVLESNPVVRTTRNKRDTKNAYANAYVNDTNLLLNNTEMSLTVESNNQSRDDSLINNNETLSTETDNEQKNVSAEILHNRTSTRNQSIELINQHGIDKLFNTPNVTNFYGDIPQVLFFYDFSGFSDDIGPSYFLSKDFAKPDIAPVKSPLPKYGQNRSKYLTMTPEGHFMAATSHHHPFLAQLFSAGCQRVKPKYAIKNTYFSQCSGFLRDDVYCENIYIIYNIV